MFVGAGRGLFASEPIEEGEIILQINSDCLVNLDYPTLPPECKKYSPPLPLISPCSEGIVLTFCGSWSHLSTHQQLTLYLLLFKDDEKVCLKEYCSSLPALEEFAGMPLLWTDDWSDRLPPATKRIPHPSLSTPLKYYHVGGQV